MTTATSLKEFWATARASAASGELIKITLSKPRHKALDLPRNRYGRLVEIKNNTQLQITHRYDDREEVKNHLVGQGISLLESALGEDYGNADLFTTTQQLSLSLSRKGNARFQRRTLNPRAGALKIKKPVLDHNREKHRDIPADRPYLQALGITNAHGQVLREGKRKFKQINKFVEIIDALLKEHPLTNGARIVDMGSGSGYLTFALYDHLVNTRALDVSVTGVELRPKLVEKCRDIANRNNFQRLHFVEGYIDDYNPDRIDMLIALHACDTATDDALHKGLLADAEIMVVAPCCQKQVRRDMEVPAGLKPMLDHGILLERQAAMLTDSMRALLLEAEGYKTKLFEFIPLEHTAKNVMITAVKAKKRPKALEEFRALRKQFGVKKHYFRKLIKGSKKAVNGE
ncbi:class I SAM-dependent methyltransferase [Neolewinella agarilytica]|uniref:class I SAM-dependent methyltransferase n=1 Tax=Neolewinella agarilytica TaxID=478744 RepID=UPI002353D3F5|nr:SAM-dependent methyltransferase [Neolewinella agarilytica]